MKGVYLGVLAGALVLLFAIPAHAMTWGVVTTANRGWETTEYPTVRSLGVSTMRDEQGPEADVTYYDSRYLQAAQYGIRFMPLLNGAGGLPADPSAFASYVANMAARFGPGGTFWQAHPELSGTLAPQVFELWNEPDLCRFGGCDSRGHNYPDRYARLVKASVVAGRAANPQARFLTSGGATLYNDNGRKWVDGMFAAVPDLGGYIDAVDTHPYGAISQIKRIATMRATFVAHGISPDVWITELGYDSSSTGEAGQASNLQQSVDALRAYPWVAAYFWFSYRDWDPGTGGYGLYRYDGSAKPSAPTYAAIVAGG